LLENDGNEETYSLIFKSLRHPIRRRILRVLANGEHTFSEILKSLSIDSGHLSYHLDELGVLIMKTADGDYRLSSIGSAAIKLMNGVEEETSAGERYVKKIQPLRNAVFLSTTLLTLILLPVIAYSLGYVAYEGGTQSRTNVSIPSEEAFSYKVTLLYGEMRSGYHGDREQRTTLDPPMKGLTSWEQDTVYFTLSPMGGSRIKARIFDSSGAVTEEPEISTDLGAGCSSMTFQVPMNRAGSSRIEVDTISSSTPSSCSLQVGFRRDRLARPYFLYGVTSILAVAVCVANLFYTWRKSGEL
jgi:DNA-binding transcriptional ArsR family regulator